MNKKRNLEMKKLIVALLATTAAVSAVQAQEFTPRAYVGAGAVATDYESRVPGASRADVDTIKASGKIFGGYEFTPNWAVEIGHTDFRSADVYYTLGNVNASGQADGRASYVAAKFSSPLTEKVVGYAKLGASHNVNELNAINSQLNQRESKNTAYGALGLQYNINQDVSVIAEYERYGKSRDFGVQPDALTIGAKYSF
jgi:hypothetical protein